MLIRLLLYLFSVGETYSVASDVPMRHNFTSNILILRLLKFFCPFIANVP